MFSEYSTDTMPLIDGFSTGVSKKDYTSQWYQKCPEVVTTTLSKTGELQELDQEITSLANSLSKLLLRFLVILYRRNHLLYPNTGFEELLKRYFLAVVAINFVEMEKLDKTLELNLHLPTLPTDSLDELLGTVDDIRDLYSYVDAAPTTAPQTTRAVAGKLIGKFVRPDFPIIFDDDE